MLRFFTNIGYIPKEKVFRVSKLARLADMYARRLQIQERLTEQLAETVMNTIKAHGVWVVIEARHLWMMMRGVEKQNSSEGDGVNPLRLSEKTAFDFPPPNYIDRGRL